MKKNDMIELKIVGSDYPAKPYGYYMDDERKCYVNKNVGIGQKISARVGKIKNNKIELRDIEILENGEDTTTPFCNKFNICGGCSFQYMSYDQQSDLKANLVFKMIDNTIKTKDYLKLPTVKMEKTIEYREKMLEFQKKLKISFHKVQAHSGDYFNERADLLAKQAAGINI